MLGYDKEDNMKNNQVEMRQEKQRLKEIITIKDKESLVAEVVARAKEYQAQGFSSIGLICKTQSNANTLFERLTDKLDIHLVGEDNDDTRGVFVIPIYMAKGLEFDAVLICDVDDKTYCRTTDRNLLYIAATRALHQLDLLCVGEKSIFCQ